MRSFATVIGALCGCLLLSSLVEAGLYDHHHYRHRLKHPVLEKVLMSVPKHAFHSYIQPLFHPGGCAKFYEMHSPKHPKVRLGKSHFLPYALGLLNKYVGIGHDLLAPGGHL